MRGKRNKSAIAKSGTRMAAVTSLGATGKTASNEEVEVGEPEARDVREGTDRLVSFSKRTLIDLKAIRYGIPEGFSETPESNPAN